MFSSAEITFAAMGGGFNVRVRNTGDYSSKGTKQDFYTFTIEKDNKGLKCTDSHSKEEAQDLMFNRFCPSDDWIYYRITVNYTASTIAITHDGPSKLFNDAECKIECKTKGSTGATVPKDIRGFTYVSFMRTSKSCEPFIRDLQVSFK